MKTIMHHLIPFILFLCLSNTGFSSEQKERPRLQERHPSFRSVKKVKVVIEQKYEGEPITILKSEDVAGWLIIAGVEVVSDTAQQYDAEVKIIVKGKSISEKYIGMGKDPQYSGAEVEGSITFTSADYQKWLRFAGKKYPPYRISTRYPTPQHAPFRKVLFALNAFPDKMAYLMDQCYGRNVLLDALDAEDPHIRQGAAEILGERRHVPALDPLITILKEDGELPVRRATALALGSIRNARAIEPLIAALKEDEEPQVRSAAAEALGTIRNTRATEALITSLTDSGWVSGAAAKSLKRITRQDFGEDIDKWNAWWEQKHGVKLELKRSPKQSVNRVKPEQKRPSIQPGRRIKLNLYLDYQRPEGASYLGGKDAVRKRIANAVREAFELAGCEITENPSTELDNVCTIKLSAEALGEQYASERHIQRQQEREERNKRLGVYGTKPRTVSPRRYPLYEGGRRRRTVNEAEKRVRGAQFLYTGVKIEGTFTFELRKSVNKYNIEGTVSPQHILLVPTNSKEPGRLPWDAVLNRAGLFEHIYDELYRSWGIEPIISACTTLSAPVIGRRKIIYNAALEILMLTVERGEHHEAIRAADALGEIKDIQTAERLIKSLGRNVDAGVGTKPIRTGDERDVTKHVLDALRSITGQDFGNNQMRWEEWLSLQNKKKSDSIGDTLRHEMDVRRRERETAQRERQLGVR